MLILSKKLLIVPAKLNYEILAESATQAILLTT